MGDVFSFLDQLKFFLDGCANRMVILTLSSLCLIFPVFWKIKIVTEVVDFEISWQVEKMRLELDNQCFCTCFRQVDI